MKTVSDLEDEEYGDPLVVGVVDGGVGAGAARAVALKVLGDVEGAVHPAVVLQGRLTHTSTRLKLYRDGLKGGALGCVNSPSLWPRNHPT